MKGLSIQGRWEEDPKKVKEEVKSFFVNKFKEEDHLEVSLDGVLFKSLHWKITSYYQRIFFEKEIKITIRDCDGNKCPGPDGCNFRL